MIGKLGKCREIIRSDVDMCSEVYTSASIKHASSQFYQDLL